jgi:DNA-binding GntR family transcriptional regulator
MLSALKNENELPEIEKVPALVVKKIREAILNEVFKPGDRLTEAELAERFEVSPLARPRGAPRPRK